MVAPWAPGWAFAQVAQATAWPPVPWAWGPEPHHPWGEGVDGGEGLWARGRQTQSPHGLRRGRGQSEGNKLPGWCDRFSSWKRRGLSLAWHQAPGTCPLCTFHGNLGSRYPCSRVHLSPPYPGDLCTPLSLEPPDSEGDPMRGTLTSSGHLQRYGLKTVWIPSLCL